MIRRPPTSTRTDTLFPYTTLFRSNAPSEPAISCTYADLKYPVYTIRVTRYQPGDKGERPPSRRRIRDTSRIIRCPPDSAGRSEEHTSELQSLMRTSYAVFCLKKKTLTQIQHHNHNYDSSNIP